MSLVMILIKALVPWGTTQGLLEEVPLIVSWWCFLRLFDENLFGRLDINFGLQEFVLTLIADWDDELSNFKNLKRPLRIKSPAFKSFIAKRPKPQPGISVIFTFDDIVAWNQQNYEKIKSSSLYPHLKLAVKYFQMSKVAHKKDLSW